MWWNFRMEQKYNYFHHHNLTMGMWMRHGANWGIFNNAHHAHAVTEHGAGVYPLSVVITSNVILRVFRLGFVLSSRSPAPALDAAVDSRHWVTDSLGWGHVDENSRCVHARCQNIDKTWETLLFCLATTKIHAWEVCSSISPLGEKQKSTGEKIRQRVWMNIILAVWEFRFWKEHCSWWECGLTGSGEVLGQCENGCSSAMKIYPEAGLLVRAL
jgi:hypothetical protein